MKKGPMIRPLWTSKMLFLILKVAVKWYRKVFSPELAIQLNTPQAILINPLSSGAGFRNNAGAWAKVEPGKKNWLAPQPCF